MRISQKIYVTKEYFYEMRFIIRKKIMSRNMQYEQYQKKN